MFMFEIKFEIDFLLNRFGLRQMWSPCGIMVRNKFFGMSVIFYLIIGLALTVSAHRGAPDDETEDDQKASSFTFRFATSTALQNDSLLSIFLYHSPQDEGTQITQDNRDLIAQQLVGVPIVYVLFNGHPSSDSGKPFLQLRKALLSLQDANVISVFIDWTKHKITFIDALDLAESFGQHIATTFHALHVDPQNYHFIAHCAGAEVASFVAERLLEIGRVKIPRLTAFDPYITNATKVNEVRQFVDYSDVYHAGIYDAPFAPIGNVDFYPNAGVEQPGCEATTRLQGFICHHRRSIYLYVESIFTAVNALEAHYHEIDQNLHVLSDPKTAVFGHMVDRDTYGTFYLPTSGAVPYLIDYF